MFLIIVCSAFEVGVGRRLDDTSTAIVNIPIPH